MQMISKVVLIVLVLFSNSENEIVGDWSGDLNIQGNRLAIVFHIKALSNSYEATIDSPDQKVKDIPVSLVSYTFPNVRFESSKIGMIFEGQLRGDQIIGTWKQSGRTFDLTLRRAKTNGK